MKERWQGSDANGTLRHVLVHISVVCQCPVSGCVLLAFFIFFLFVYFLRTDPWRRRRALSKTWSYHFKLWEHTAKRLSPNEDLGLCVVFTYIWCFGSFLLWIIESWLEHVNYPTKYNPPRKIHSFHSFAFLLWWKERGKKPRDSTGCNFNRSFQPVLTFTKFW